MNDDGFGLVKSDVMVDKIDECCEDCPAPVTHVVKVDFRSAGTTREIGRFCRKCATNVQKRIRDGLPK